MKWVSHKIVTASVVYAVTGVVLPIIPAVLGSVFPDSVEGRSGVPGTARYRVWAQRHRRTSHWFVPYLLVAGVSAVPVLRAGILVPDLGMLTGGRASIELVLAFAVFWFSAGCLLHLAEDMFSGKIPGLHPRGKRVGFRVLPVGGIGEALFACASVIVSLSIRGVWVIR